MQIETTVLNGFPVIVEYEMMPAEPSVGINYSYPEDVEILTMRGQPATFIEKKMSRKDWDKLLDELR